MRTRLLVLIFAGALGMAGFSFAPAKSTGSSIGDRRQPVAKSLIPQNQAEADPPGTIDGARSPEMIPDHVAYSLLFNLLAGRKTATERESIRSYIAQAGLADETDIDALLAVAEEFRLRADIIDKRAESIKAKGGQRLGMAAVLQLNELQRQKEGLVLEVVDSLPARLSALGAVKLRLHINERVKRKIKIIPGPMMPAASHSM